MVEQEETLQETTETSIEQEKTVVEPTINPPSDSQNNSLIDETKGENQDELMVSETAQEEELSAFQEVEAEQAKRAEVAEKAKTVVQEILSDEYYLEQQLKKAGLPELVLLMENIAEEEEEIGALIPKVRLLLKTYQKQKTEKSNASLIGRFELAQAKFNKKRSAYYKEQDRLKVENSEKKQALLDRLKEITQNEEVEAIEEVRAIQKEWRETGWVLSKDIQPLNKTFKYYLDIFYGLRAQHHELLELDRKYNQEEKEAINKEIEALTPSEEALEEVNWKELTTQVNILQESWKDTGPAPKEVSDSLYEQYKKNVDAFFEQRNKFFQIKDAHRQENASEKEALLRKLIPFESFKADKSSDWNNATNKVIAFQKKWNDIGPAPREVNKALWKRYHEVCDAFFKQKSYFFQALDQKRAKNLKLKVALCEQAEAIMNEENWKETGDKLKSLQKEWKKIGPVQERFSNKIWKRFRKACDHFFERRDVALKADREAADENIAKKKALTEQINTLAETKNPIDSFAEFEKLVSEWNKVGFVPKNEKAELDSAFSSAKETFLNRIGNEEEVVVKFRLKHKIKRHQKTSSPPMASHYKEELQHLRKKIRYHKENLATYENNIHFAAKGRAGDALRKQFQQNIEKEQAIIDSLKNKVKLLQQMQKDAEKEN